MKKLFVLFLACALLCGCCRKTKKVDLIPDEPVTVEVIKKVPDKVVPDKIVPFIVPDKDPVIINYNDVVYFDFDQAEIRLDAVKVLNEAVKAAREATDATIELKAGCCPIGTEEYNLGLSKSRGDEIRNYFINKLNLKWDTKRIAIIALGETQLVTDIESEYWKNRRCEIKIKN